MNIENLCALCAGIGVVIGFFVGWCTHRDWDE